MKRIIAREWLFLLFFILLGSILTILFYFNDNNQFIEKNNLYNYKRHHFYNALTEEYKIKVNDKIEFTKDKIELTEDKIRKGKNPFDILFSTENKIELTEDKIAKQNENKDDQLLNILKKTKMNKNSSINSGNNTDHKDLKTNQLKNNPYYKDLSKIEPPPYRMDLEGIIKSVRQDTCKPLSRLQQWAADKHKIFNDTINPLGTYEQFYAILDVPKERTEFYDNLFYNSGYINDYSSFEVLFLTPVKSSLFNDFLEFYDHLFSKYHWFQTWLTVLALYFVFIFIRTIVYSIRVLKQK